MKINELNSSVFLFIFSIKNKPITQPIRSKSAPNVVNNVEIDFSPASFIIKFEYTRKISIPFKYKNIFKYIFLNIN